MSKHHAIYMRVSTKRQDTASQEPELRRWAQSHDGDSCWYHDSYTGTSMDRPGCRTDLALLHLSAAATFFGTVGHQRPAGEWQVLASSNGRRSPGTL